MNEQPKPLNRSRMPWQQWEDDLISESFDNESIAQQVGRTPKAVAKRRYLLGAVRYRRWQPWEIDLFWSKSDAEIAAATGRSRNAVSVQRQNYAPETTQRRIWEPWEDELVKSCSNKEVSRRTGRSYRAVAIRRHYLKRKHEPTD